MYKRQGLLYVEHIVCLQKRRDLIFLLLVFIQVLIYVERYFPVSYTHLALNLKIEAYKQEKKSIGNVELTNRMKSELKAEVGS